MKEVKGWIYSKNNVSNSQIINKIEWLDEDVILKMFSSCFILPLQGN